MKKKKKLFKHCLPEKLKKAFERFNQNSKPITKMTVKLLFLE